MTTKARRPYAAKRIPNDARPRSTPKARVSVEARWSTGSRVFRGFAAHSGNARSDPPRDGDLWHRVGAATILALFYCRLSLAGGGTQFGLRVPAQGDPTCSGRRIIPHGGAGYISGALRIWLAGQFHDRNVTLPDDRLMRGSRHASRAAPKGIQASVSPWVGGPGIAPYARGTVHEFRFGLAETFFGSDTLHDLWCWDVRIPAAELGFRTDKNPLPMQNAILTCAAASLGA